MPTSRPKTLRVRLSDTEKRRLGAIADAAGLSASDWVRQQIRRNVVVGSVAEPIVIMSEGHGDFEARFNELLAKALEEAN